MSVQQYFFKRSIAIQDVRAPVGSELEPCQDLTDCFAQGQ